MKTSKFQADLASTDEITLNVLMKELEVRSKADFLAKALALMNWAVKERKRGNKIVSMDEQGEVIRELVTPELERVASDFELPSVSMTWTASEIESFAKLASEEQPKPTPQLVRAMNRRR
ncbi:MAG TPA: hypothetical protein VG759_11875 [Candidatus Angelobacter sp.]|jgi:hypothetical protein|nr:hypothetical protein [Candidatus Angelobacter sp.]